MFDGIVENLRCLYLDDPRPWLVGFSGGKGSTMLASLIFEVVAKIPETQRTKPIAVLCTDTASRFALVTLRIWRYLGRDVVAIG